MAKPKSTREETPSVPPGPYETALSAMVARLYDHAMALDANDASEVPKMAYSLVVLGTLIDDLVRTTNIALDNALRAIQEAEGTLSK